MGTGYSNKITFTLTGDIYEDYEDGAEKNTDICEAELNLIAKKYGLDLFLDITDLED